MKGQGKILIVLGSILLSSCSLITKSAAPDETGVKSNPSYQAQIRCPGKDAGTLKVLKMKVSKDQDLIACGNLQAELSDTVFVLAAPRIVKVDHRSQQVTVLLNLKEEEHREIVWNSPEKRVLIFEDVPFEKKLPLFSQEISCKNNCVMGEKVCLFRKDVSTFVDPIKQNQNLEALLTQPDGQVQILLAALSDYKPAIEAFKQRTPQSLAPKAADSFKLRKSQLAQAQSLCGN